MAFVHVAFLGALRLLYSGDSSSADVTEAKPDLPSLLFLWPELPPSESPSCGVTAMPTVQLSHGRLGLPSHSHGSVPKA